MDLNEAEMEFNDAEVLDLNSLDFLLPELPEDGFDSFLMDWLASDVLPQTSTLEQEHQPLHQNLHTPLSNPAPSTSQSTPAQWDISSQPQPLLQLIPTPSSTPGLHSSQSTPGQWGTSSLPQPQPSAFGDLTIQQSEEDRSAPTDVPQPRMPPLVPTAERSGSGRYGLRTRSAHQREGMIEDAGSEEEGSPGEGASEGGSDGTTRRHSGKRLVKMISLASNGVSTVGKGFTGTMQAVKGKSPSFSTIQGAAVGGASGIASTLRISQRRSKDPEVIKQKELARNRRAQKAFRDRQKALQSERTQSMRHLQESMGHLVEENSELKRKLKRVDGVRLSTKSQAQVDVSFGLPQDMSQEEPISLSSNPSNPVEIPVEAVADLTFCELVGIWKGYVECMLGLLHEAEAEMREEVYLRLACLVKELARLSQVCCNMNSRVWMAFQHSCMLDFPPTLTKAPCSHWKNVVVALQLTEYQIEEILEQRRQAFTSLAAILRQRDELLQIQIDSLSSLTSASLQEHDISHAHVKANEALQSLIDNLRAEQNIVLHSFCIVQQRTFSPIQRAIGIARSWPYYPGSLEIASALAQQRGDPSAAALLGINASASGTNWSRSTATASHSL